MKTRQYLENSILLCEENNGEKFKRKFTIVKKIDEGASAVCYEAYHDNSGRGTLKEYYPQNTYFLERNSEGQLICSDGFEDAHNRFLKGMEEYKESYKMLLAAKQKSDFQELSTFIPAFEIYRGCDADGNIIGTAYIWTPEPKLETFDKVCEDIHKHPRVNPEHKLVTVLNAIESLAKCVDLLHSAEMIHRDIKPSNFGFVRRGNETLTQTLSLFDINSICSVYAKTTDSIWTKGYIEPEAVCKNPSNQTDIYAIGATLFNAVVVCDETKKNGYVYKDEYYTRLREFVDNSDLIRASESNSHPRLRNALTTVLRKCLCEREYRYVNCEELANDLKTALYYALPSEIAKKMETGQKWVLTDVEKSLDTVKEKNSSLAIKYHLYEYPLYRSLKKNENRINVLVIGFGNYGQKFLDACLQAGQIIRKALNVKIIFDDSPNKQMHLSDDKDDKTDKQIYLSERPELNKFFNVEGSLGETDDSYGNITFETLELARNNQKANAEILQNIMCDQYDYNCPQYIFIALGEDELNISAARACAAAAEILEMDCTISYVSENENITVNDNRCLPVYVNADVKKSKNHSEIERMALNAHLIWEKNLNVDHKIVKSAFKKKYYHDSCVSNVLSLKYKLYSIGIDLGKTAFDEAADLFAAMIADKRNRDIKNELIWIEHRRWVTEKLCLGWKQLKDLNSCVDGITKDERRKQHICIVRSKPERKLCTSEYKNNNHKKWDKASKTELNQLDELERMSVELHRVFDKKAKQIKKNNILSGHIMESIQSLIENDRKSVAAFQEWYICIRDILNEEFKKVYLYEGIKKAFLNAVDQLPKSIKKSVRMQVNAFEALFYPVRAGMEFRDWKEDDVKLVENIPFILTYTDEAYVAIPYTTGSKTEVFSNVSSATVINPARILYLYLIEDEQDIISLKSSLPSVIEYMKKKNFKAAVDMVLISSQTADIKLSENLFYELKQIGQGRIRLIKPISDVQFADIPEAVSEYLKRRSARKRTFIMEVNKTSFSRMLQISGVYDSFEHYKFDAPAMKFQCLKGCSALRYINKAPCINISDLTAFNLSIGEINSQPEFFADYKELWTEYCNNKNTWKSLCESLNKYAAENDVIASFRRKSKSEKSIEPSLYTYILPFKCAKNAKKILDFLKKQNIAERASNVRGYTTESCEVKVFDCCNYKTEYDKLFSKVYALMTDNDISLSLNTKSHIVDIAFDDLTVSDAVLSEKRNAGFEEIINFFKEKGYIINVLGNSCDGISFTYSTKQIKRLLTTSGRMLEVYVYHKLKELGRFDDIVNDFEIYWEETDVRSEFDCILTKGFRTLFIECKARSDIEQEFYYKISQLNNQFGVGATAVLVADTQEKPHYDSAKVNAMQRRRGNMLNVVTIWKPNEINNIGHTLMKVINGTYISEEE